MARHIDPARRARLDRATSRLAVAAIGFNIIVFIRGLWALLEGSLP